MYNKYTPTYLYVKYHKLTNLKYFGKTIRDPYSYLGSGTRWLRHIKKHGPEHVDTLWAQLFPNKEELVEFATKFSYDNQIVENNEWANIAVETGLDGGARINAYFKTYNSLPRSEDWLNAQSLSKKGKILTPNAYTIEARTKLSNSLKSIPIVECPHCGKLGKKFGRFKGAHFDKCKITG